MNKYSLSFLEKDLLNLFNLSKEIDSVIYSDPHSAISKSRLFAEKLLAEVIEKEDESYLNGQGYKQYEKIKILAKEGILPDFIERAFDSIRIIGNKAIHEGINNDLEFAIKVHKNLYVLAKWVVETYGSNYELEVPEYTLPEHYKEENNITKKELEKKIEEKLEKYIEQLNKRKLAREGENHKADVVDNRKSEEMEAEKNNVLKVDNKKIVSKEDKLYGYTFEKSKGSYLINELEKLSDSSQEAVESASSLDVFKKYLHVNRSIQKNLREAFFKAYRSEEAQIVLVSGSVGDGKSHLLAYLNEEYPEEFKSFKIHNDATESFAPNLNEIETLEKVLEEFSDEKIDKSKEKLILAINLGVLHNFLEANFTKEKFGRFYNFIKESGVFKESVTENVFAQKNFEMVSFGNYNIYELTKEGPKSEYIENLLRKIIKEDEENPFLKAYKLDKEEGISNPVLDNYEILKIKGVVEKISELLVFIIVKYKRLISTREILNFIYEILVPANISDFDLATDDEEYLKVILPNLLFATLTRGPLLGIISNEDPIKTRSKELDKFLIDINISINISESLEGILDTSLVRSMNNQLDLIGNFDSIGENAKQQLIETIIRCMYLFSEEKYKSIFNNEDYRKYTNYLYFYNKGDSDGYIDIFEDVKKAIFKWNGSPREDYIYLNEILNNYKVSERLMIEPTDEIGICNERNEEILESFKGNITLGFEIGDELVSLTIDYELYKKLMMVTKGYCVSKNDKEEAVIFIEFIDKILRYGDMKKELLIEDLREDKYFKLTYKSMGKKFKFERDR